MSLSALSISYLNGMKNQNIGFRSINAITNGSASPELIEYLSVKIVSGTPISIVLADKNEDNSTLTLWVKNTPAISDKRYSLSFTMKSLYKPNDIDVFFKNIR
ncbi:hypothetical protein EH227_07280 [Rouxiella chamberiensis]|nr:hypothetical protein EH227_07280 [Rouxiella chamberiensis]